MNPINQDKTPEQKKPEDTQPKKGRSPKEQKDQARMVVFALLALAFFVVLQFAVFPGIDIKKLSYSDFFTIVASNPETGYIQSAELVENIVRGKMHDGTYFTVNIPINDPELMPILRSNIRDFTVNPTEIFWRNLVYSVLPVLLLIGFFWFFVYRGVQSGGGRILSFGKSRARQTNKDDHKITFEDVAGVEEAKEELQEIIEFLRDPKKFQKLGGKIPKGVLLMGAPGTGKTLLAKAVAGEAGVPFFSISGSDFVEMFVGVGASRVRDLFEQAKKAAAQGSGGAIIFIDEIDAVGRQRFAGVGGGNDEREQTLNALLVEMDGFDTHLGVILIGATNRPDVLDPALLRPGRFDRSVTVDRPDLNGREAILKVHSRNVKLDPSVDLKKLARQTPGFSGADLANLVNEGALLSARFNKETVGQTELEASIERVMAGPERKSKVISKKEKETVAAHESGHALLAMLLPGADPVHKVSIIPRGHAALGYTLQMPLEDRHLITEQEILDKITVLMGGRVAEELTFNVISSGAQNDLEVATRYAQSMVCEFGMSKKLGHMTFGKKDHQPFLGRDMMGARDFSEQTAQLIDEEVRRIIDTEYRRAISMLTDNFDKLKLLTEQLLEVEVLDGDRAREIVGVPPIKRHDIVQDTELPGAQAQA